MLSVLPICEIEDTCISIHIICFNSQLLEGKFGVERRACVDLQNNRYNRAYKQGVSVDSIYLLVGSMCLEALGTLKNPLSDTPNFLLPVNYW